jgi:hypothetical protein
VPRRALTALAAALLAASCSGDGGGGDGEGGGGAPDATGAAGTTLPAATAGDLCAGAQAAPAGRVAHPALTEASGLAASRTQPGLLWSHNDSGGDPEVFAIGQDGGDRGRWSLPGAGARDWEDMALGPGAGDATGVLYLGDIGDNDARREDVVVYRADEPQVPRGAAGGELAEVEALTLTYADGPHDAEALLADPVTGDLFVVTKQSGGGPAGAYRIPARTAGGTTTEMARVGDVAGTGGSPVTGGDISPDGSVIALRTYAGVLLWDRAPGQTVPDALAGEPCTAPSAAEPQGETVALAADGRGYVTISEGANPPVNAFRLPEG